MRHTDRLDIRQCHNILMAAMVTGNTQNDRCTLKWSCKNGIPEKIKWYPNFESVLPNFEIFQKLHKKIILWVFWHFQEGF